MLKTSIHWLILSISLGAATSSWSQDVDLGTLFTTEQERRVINANRYKEEDKPKREPVKTEQAEPAIQFLKEEVQAKYTISGVSTDLKGSQTAWVNGKSYLSGEKMDDGSKVSVRGTSVIITTTDGKQHKGKSGEVLDVTYLRTIEN
jgi:hypothetical protein